MRVASCFIYVHFILVDGRSYMAIVHNRTDGKTDEYLGLLDVNRTGNKPAKVLIPSLQHNTVRSLVISYLPLTKKRTTSTNCNFYMC